MKRYGLHLAWLIALIATFGSLFFGEFKHHEPCPLCWYQRILLFPLAIILGIAVVRKTPQIILYVLPLTLLGLGLAIYHVVAIRLGFNCKSCKVSELTTRPYSFPLLSLAAFALINLFLIWTALLNRKSKKF